MDYINVLSIIELRFNNVQIGTFYYESDIIINK